MLIVRTLAELNAALQQAPPRALVPTMGALHQGHLDLVRAAGQTAAVVASIFVNPLQFGPGEDLSRYPRDEAGDLRALDGAGCAVAFLPRVNDIYPPKDATTIEVAGPALGFEGERRPGHFRGVATVVARLCNLVRPESAWFGQKDWQQLQVIRRMVADLRMNVAICDLPTVREADGLALSSRNRFLSAAERAVAPELARIGLAAAGAIRGGAQIGTALSEAVAALAARGFGPEYCAVVDPASLRPIETLDGPARLIAAARLGSVRLLDNFAV